MNRIYNLLFYFIIYAFLGWCLEVAYAFYKTKRFVNRGFLKGPFCPIYGCGVVLLYLINSAIMQRLELNPYVNLPLVFIIVTVVTTGLEYLTGAVLKRIFHTRWWDYSGRWLNIKGYVCLKFSILWGVAGTFLILYLHQYAMWLVNIIPKRYGQLFLAVTIPYLTIDSSITIKELINFKHLFIELEQIAEELKTSRSKLLASLEAIQKLDSGVVLESVKGIKEKVASRTQAILEEKALLNPLGLEELKDKLDSLERRLDLRKLLADAKNSHALLEMKRDIEIWSKRYYDITMRISRERLFKAFPEMESKKYAEHLRQIKLKYQDRLKK